jgi:Bacterial Ig domain
MSSNRFSVSALSLLLLASVVLGACNMHASARGTSVWLDVPLDGLSFPAPQAIKIEGHAAGAAGISRVEVLVQGAIVATIDDPAVAGDLATFHTAWTPAAEGTYTIQAVAYGRDGTTSAPDSARVTFGGASPTPLVGCPSPVGGGPTPPPPCPATPVGCPSPIGGGPTPPPPCPTLPPACPSPVGGGPTPVTCPTLPVITVITPGADVQFWAEPATIDAGACTDIRWHAANVKAVVFGGAGQPLDGSYEACLCNDERYTLTVTHLDGTEERKTVDVAVEGECVTEVPADTLPPPVPEPAVPANGLNIACKASQTLAWLPVNDPSKISEYRVQVQRHSGDGNWRAASGSPFTGISGKQMNVSVECGWYYRWRVEAVDGVGNESGFSDWSEFTITLG